MSVLQSPHQTRHPAPSHLPAGHHHTDIKNSSSGNNSSSGSSGGGDVHRQQDEDEEEEVTPIPHQIRGSLHKFTQMDITVSHYHMIISQHML